MQLSPNFSLEELTESATALRLGIDNNPGTIAKQNLRTLTEAVLQPTRSNFGKPVRITSGYRSLALNDAVNSKPSSQHIMGQAADFKIPGVHNYDVACWIRDNLEYDQLILEFAKLDDPFAGWIHCSYVKDRNRKQVLTVGVAGTKEGL